MPYREGDKTVVLEGKLVRDNSAQKAVLFDLDTVGETWIPRSQIVEISDPDAEGGRTIEVTHWWAEKNGFD